MGSFDGTCSVSNLPIRCGTPVRFLLLNRNPFAGSDPEGGGVEEYVSGLWKPRTFPIRAEYNDYGSIENWQNETAVQLVMEAFKQDIIEQGTGPNQCHHVPVVLKDMEFEDMLEALWERRVKTYWLAKKPKVHPASWTPTRLPKPIPDLMNVCDALEAAGLPTNKGKEPGVRVTDVSYGVCCVRAEGFGGYSQHEPVLQKALTILSEPYAPVIVAGAEEDVELMVYPKPHQEDQGNHKFWFRRRAGDRKPPIPVTVCMVREDVWHALLATPTPHVEEYDQEKGTVKARKDDKWTLSALKKSAAEVFEPTLPVPEKSKGFPDELRNMLRKVQDLRTVPMLAALNSEFGEIAPGSHWKILEEKIGAGEKIPENDLKMFLDDAAEFVYVNRMMRDLRRSWQPFGTIGEQCGDHKTQRQFYENLLEVVKKSEKREKRNR